MANNHRRRVPCSATGRLLIWGVARLVLSLAKAILHFAQCEAPVCEVHHLLSTHCCGCGSVVACVFACV
jgi:hypothetical protein